jgi:hypothetical protein
MEFTSLKILNGQYPNIIDSIIKIREARSGMIQTKNNVNLFLW